MNCKQGDLAIITDAARCTNALGAIVEVLRPYTNGLPFSSPEGQRHNNSPRWWVRASRKLEVLGNDRMIKRDEFVAPDSALRPIRPGDISDTEVADLYAPTPTRTTETA